MQLISKEDLLVDINDLLVIKSPVIEELEYRYKKGVTDSIDRISNANVINITSCKDCKYLARTANSSYCMKLSKYECLITMCDDDFCSRGEKK